MATELLDRPIDARPKPQRRRRGRGEGSIFQRADGRWTAIVSLGTDGNGKRIRRTIYGSTKGEVQSALLRLQVAGSAGTRVSVDKTTVGDALEKWLADLEGQGGISPGTLANYRCSVRLHIRPRGIAGKRVQKLTADDVQEMLTEMARDKVGAHSRKLAHNVIRQMLGTWVKQRIATNNACDAVDAPRISKAQIQPLSEKQAAALLAAATGNRLEALYHLAIGSGMRVGEIFGLHWSSIDLAAGTVSVRQSLSEIGGKLTLRPPKSKAGRRLITLPACTVAAMEQHRKRMMVEGFAGVEMVFCNPSGGYMRRSHFGPRDFKPLLKRAGLPKSTRFHDLRHTHATLCLLAGENPKVVQERLGHSSVVITLDTYSHVLPSVKTDAASKLDGIIRAAMLENGCQQAVKAG